ncbi:MAG: signal peptidase I [Sphingomicrobium sp.]
MAGRRSLPARIGIASLNLLGPGLGLLRVSRWKSAVAFFMCSLSVLIAADVVPPVSFRTLTIVFFAALSLYPLAIGMTWCVSQDKPENYPWYGRWYSISAATLFSFLVSFVLSDPDLLRYHSLYMPSDAMAPTLLKGDRLIAYRTSELELKRGDLVVIRGPRGVPYIKRIAALPGDTVEMRAGVVILNGRAVSQSVRGIDAISDYAGLTKATRLSEQFVGEVRPHLIYDLEPTFVDDLQAQKVAAGHVFVLGDNRDRSVDSRMSRDEMGLAQVAVSDVVGRLLYHNWRSSRPMGTPIR